MELLNFIIENKESVIAVLVALGIPAALAKLARDMVARMPTKWKVVDDKLTLGLFDKLLRYIFGTAAVLANAKPDGIKAAELLIEFKREYDSKKKMPIPFNDGINE